ncbi:hypothetical protein D1AOALGA4SA_10466 [Olavius algarvensis Delta 1 endosymbiont]|nr:hypothetical protein D1AOALGA4SA_10466 [Olavius algarvensis Delta 1 endosymbiont]
MDAPGTLHHVILRGIEGNVKYQLPVKEQSQKIIISATPIRNLPHTSGSPGDC